jgi:polysaccharide export outer membrane protein
MNNYAVKQKRLTFLSTVADVIHSAGNVGLILVILCLSSCASNKNVTYFQNNNSVDTKYSATLSSSNPAPLRIQSEDMLAIVVSSMSEETNALFNVLNSSAISTPHFSTGGGSQPLGYLVDMAGEVNLPLVGKVRVAGLTLDEANAYITNQLVRYVKSPTVNVRVLNHKFTVIGEVVRPGIYNLSDKPTTLPEVIGMAGDLTLYGQRNKVKLIRTINNKREIVELDLTSQQIFNSPYYFIENNDVVYVEASASKTFSVERPVQLLPIGLALTSTALLIANLLSR